MAAMPMRDDRAAASRTSRWIRENGQMRSLRALLLGAAGATAFGAAAHADVTVAVAGPITGQYAVFGEQMKRGATMAAKDINAKGGLDGQKLQLQTGDDACDPKQAVAVANQLVNQGVIFVDGHFCSSSSIPASAVYNEEGVLQITPASTNPKLTEQGFKNVFRTCGRDDVQGTYAANYVIDHKLGDKVAIVQDQSQYGKGLADEFKKEFNKKGGKELMYEAVTQGDKDFSALITKMKSAGVKLIYYGGYHTEAGLLVRQARDQGLDATLMSGDALVDQQFWNITGPSGEGTLMTFAPDPRKLPTAAAVVKEFEAEGYNPEGYTLYTYAAMQIFADAATKAGSTKLDALEKVMHSTTFDTVLGPIQFDEKGDVTNPKYVMYRWHDGKYEEIS
jgi:branched-chain amino acid transport system substrate-binding protein